MLQALLDMANGRLPITRSLPSMAPMTFRQMGGYGRITSPSQEIRRRSRDLPGATDADPSGKKAGPVENAGPGNTGFERFLDLHRGSRGGRIQSSKTKGAFRYTSGKYKGMTKGEVDIMAHRQFQKMSDKQRDQFRPMNEGDFAKARERKHQMARDQHELALEFKKKNQALAGEIADENDPDNAEGAEEPWNPSGEESDPIVRGAKGDSGAQGTAGAPGSSPVKRTRRINAAGGRPIGRGRRIGL